MREKFSSDDLKFINTLEQLEVDSVILKYRLVLWIVALFVTFMLIWFSYAKIDEVVRGSGKVIPSHQVQIVQNLEGGIIREILVKEGDRVQKGDLLLRLDSIRSSSDYSQQHLRYDELFAKSLRLKAEASNSAFLAPKKSALQLKPLLEKERSLYESNQVQLTSALNRIASQYRQKEREKDEISAKNIKSQQALQLLQEEINITKPLVKKGLVSEVSFIQLKRQKVALQSEVETHALHIVRLDEELREIKNKQESELLGFMNKAKEAYNSVTAEMSRIAKQKEALKDRVTRAEVRSPVDGTIKRLLVNTISGVVRPAMDMVEIVPSDDRLLIETKIRPQDIAFLYRGLDAIVKFSAYDFSIHGGLHGRLTHISADTITNEKGESFYLAHIKTDTNYIGKEKAPLQIMVGMRAEVDIITGKKSVLDYILKPIFKTYHRALHER